MNDLISDYSMAPKSASKASASSVAAPGELEKKIADELAEQNAKRYKKEADDESM